MRTRWCLSAAFAVVWTAGLTALHWTFAEDSPESSSRLSQYYGFLEPELFKLDERIRNLRASDLNADGLTDLVVIDNAHSRLDVLLAREKQPAESPETSRKANDFSDHWRFRLVKVPVNRQVTSLALGDFNSDQRVDLAYTTVPSELVILFQDAQGKWSRRRPIPVADLPQTSGILASGDLNGDQRDDVVMLGTNQTFVIYQKPDGELDDPLSIPNTAQKLTEPRVADVDGDGRNDLLYQSGDDAKHPVCVRFQEEAGRLGSEIRFELPEVRDGTLRLAEIDAAPGLEMLFVENRTNRAKVFTFESGAVSPDEEGGPSASLGQLVLYGLGSEQSGRDRLLAFGDLDGDKLQDVVVSDPGSAQLIVFRQAKDRALANGVSFPGMLGVNALCVSDLDGDGRDEVLLASEQEKALGICRLQEERLTFPVALPTEIVPVAAAVANLDGQGTSEVVYVGRHGTGSSARYELRALIRNESGEWSPWTFGSEEKSAIPLALRGNPEGLIVFDANQDNRPDYLIFAGFNRPPIFLSTPSEGVPEVRESGAGFGIGGATFGGVFVGDLEGPVLLMAQKNFARSLVVDEQGRWQVIDQYNGPPNAKIAGVSALDIDRDGVKEIVLVEEGADKLRFLRRRDQVYRPWQELDLGQFSFKAAHVGDFNGDGSDDLLIFGAAKFGVLYSRSDGRRLREIASFESALKDVRFTDVIAGDLNHDGRPDLALIDAAQQYLQIVAVGADSHLVAATHFKVFESKSFAAEFPGGNEPREGIVAEVTGDDRSDVVLLVHDRILVYPQDAGGDDTAAEE